MLLIDTSVWINLFRSNEDELYKEKLTKLIDGKDFYLSRFTQTELLQGAKNEKEWTVLSSYLSTQDYINPSIQLWSDAARIFYELRRQGITVRNTIDCLIAASAIEHDLLLLHDDRDFTAISSGTALNQTRISSSM